MLQVRRLIFVLALLPTPVAGQRSSAPDLQPEARVRVMRASPDDAWLTGRLQQLTTDTLTLRVRDDVRALPLAEVQHLQASRGRKRTLWAAGGALTGAVAGVVYSRATLDDDPADIGGVQNSAEGVANTLTGALFGAVIGYFVAPERWRAVTLPLRGD
jgi:hypothetical protein